MSKKFKTLSVLSSASGIFCCEDMGEIYEVLNYMTGDNLFTHQLPRAMKESAPYIYKQHPWMDGFEKLKGLTKENSEAFMRHVNKTYGEYLELDKIPNDKYHGIDAVKELADMMNKNK